MKSQCKREKTSALREESGKGERKGERERADFFFFCLPAAEGIFCVCRCSIKKKRPAHRGGWEEDEGLDQQGHLTKDCARGSPHGSVLVTLLSRSSLSLFAKKKMMRKGKNYYPRFCCFESRVPTPRVPHEKRFL